MKSLDKNQYQKLTVAISPSEKEAAKEYARSKGMTLQGLIGQLIKKELNRQDLFKEEI